MEDQKNELATISDSTPPEATQVMTKKDASFLENAQSLDLAMKAATMLSKSSFIPDGLRDPGSCLFIMELAQRSGKPISVVADGIDVVKGKPSIKTAFAMTLFREGTAWELFWDESEPGVKPMSVVCRVRDKKTKEVQSYSLYLDINMVRRRTSGLSTQWDWQPEQMLRYRSAKFLLRAHFPEVCLGLPISGDEVEESAEPSVTSVSDRMALLESPVEPDPIPVEDVDDGTTEIAGTDANAAYIQYTERMDAANTADDMRAIYTEAAESGDLSADGLTALGDFATEIMGVRQWN